MIASHSPPYIEHFFLMRNLGLTLLAKKQKPPHKGAVFVYRWQNYQVPPHLTPVPVTSRVFSFNAFAPVPYFSSDVNVIPSTLTEEPDGIRQAHFQPLLPVGSLTAQEIV
jgi:hypothetical protein